MQKPFYKKWGLWLTVILIGGIIGLINGGEEPVGMG